MKKLKNSISRFFTSLLFALRGGEEQMAVIYATLIVKGLKTYAEVPATIKEQVAEVLKALEAEHLITQ